MNLERLLRGDFKEKELLEMYHQIIETEPLKFKILKKVKCKKCGWCCKAQNAMLTIDDVKRLCTYLKCNYEELREKYLDKNMKIPYLKSPCPFLDGEDKCTIYNIRPKVCKIYPFVDFFMVVKPCLLGEEIYNIIIENGHLFKEDNERHDSGHLQELYNDRINMLDSIAGNGISKGVEYHSMFIDKNILGKLIKILKKNNRN